MTTAQIAARIKIHADRYALASADHARLLMLRVDSGVSRCKSRDEREAALIRDVAFTALSDSCTLMAEAGLKNMALLLLRRAIDAANVAEQVACVQALEAIRGAA
jgi:hypothetical protein